jgi:hypothetical protein
MQTMVTMSGNNTILAITESQAVTIVCKYFIRTPYIYMVNSVELL